MKNILAENMLRFGTKNLSESAKLILQEQNDDYWDKHTSNGTTSATTSKSFPTVPYMNPDGKTQLVLLSDNSKIFIGANLIASHNPNAKRFNSERMKYTLELFFTRKEGHQFDVTFRGVDSDSSRSGWLFADLMATPDPNTKQWTFTLGFDKGASIAKYKWPDITSGTLTNLIKGALSKNFYGWIPSSLTTQINAELQLMGFPVLPKSISNVA